MRVAGTGAMSGRLLESRTTASPPGGVPVNVTRADEALPPATVDGVSDNAESATAKFSSVSVLFAGLVSGVLLVTDAWWVMVPGPVVRIVNPYSRPKPIVSMGGTSQTIVFGATWHSVPSVS